MKKLSITLLTLSTIVLIFSMNTTLVSKSSPELASTVNIDDSINTITEITCSNSEEYTHGDPDDPEALRCFLRTCTGDDGSYWSKEYCIILEPDLTDNSEEVSEYYKLLDNMD